MSDFIDDMPFSITEYLQNYRDSGIKKALDLLDIVKIDINEKKKIRKAIIDGFNDFYTGTCRVLTYIQEKENESKDPNN